MDDAVHPDLWAKVAALDQCCRVQFTRVGPAGQPKRWLVIIQHDTGEVTAEDYSLTRAITAAILAAETRGWR